LESILARGLPVLGIVVFMAICLAVSTDRKAALKRWDLILWGLGLQFFLALLILPKNALARPLFTWFNDVFIKVIGCTQAGSEFVFGPLATQFGDGNVATVSYVKEAAAGNPGAFNNGFNFAFAALTIVIFFSALTSVLYHFGVMQTLVKGVAWVMMRTMKTSGAETLSASANIFVGQTEAPLMVAPFLKRMTRSELMTVMTGGFATVAGSVMGAYVAMMSGIVDGIAGHLLAASIMSAPAALLFGKLMVPETEIPETSGKVNIVVEKETANMIDAATVGTKAGVKLAINVAGMLIAFLALIALADLILVGYMHVVLRPFFSASVVEEFLATNPDWITLKGVAGYIFFPVAWLMGVTDWSEARMVGQLMGVKIVANEFVAFLDLAAMGSSGQLSQRSAIIASYALCGFANFASIGIQIGGLAVLAPERRKDLSQLGLRAMFAGAFAANSTACIAAMMI
jgi:concentrative nucleoside transporter, CNT family